ncbi:hypothetical protein A3J90_05450 [candidate division WOR-1 bacterium RIFOXYC2_FULL_37_10]|uniref:SLH domain-containing protein n=1 Tax=candidate division WOR-1 bacterium RIFOXYB2_FULL_37_13 TaxID=1802579 RepID=A0A1F4SUX5_UNCSA|nr:MAG: hypothetical protein A2310_06790 [candidate division WOR-1 bacterium RIFOXYB2_FULL_37_13]OGC36479.1 MAG: hypothetical protein A3J90_05450 [candidate division WOR-1 bacterium RIFOXYC2_FULL_37_10]
MKNKTLLTTLIFVFLFYSFAFAVTKVANDPTQVSVGARVLGMGKTFVGVSDDISSMFVNPAGLSNLENWQLTSMAGKFINEINYINLGYAYPLPKGTLSLAYVGSNIGFIAPAPTIDTVDGVRVILSTTEGVAYNYDNNAVLFSGGVKLKEFIPISFLQNFAAGFTFKLFSQALSGPDISNGSASGKDIDAGLLFDPYPALRFGVTGQNILPFDMGGKIVWKNGIEESLPSTIKLGGSLKLLGKNGLRQLGTHNFLIALDYDIKPNDSSLPGLYHFGLEWSPLDILNIRMGIDQDFLGTSDEILETANNFTAGIGFLLNGYRFDYAYHQYYSISDNDTHYFSLSYGIWETKPPMKEFVEILSPLDQTIAYENNVKINGVILQKQVKRVTINEIEIPFDGMTFETTVNLNLGKNGFVLSAFDGKGKILAKKYLKILRLATFNDISKDYFAKLPIECMATLGTITGYPDGTFKSENRITRAEFLTLLLKSGDIKESGPREPLFLDVPDSNWAAKFINLASNMQLVTGYPDGNFRPNQSILRVEGIVIVSRFDGLDVLQPVYEIPYRDIPGRYWAINEINAARSAGFLKFLGERFEPNKALTRGETSEILSHTKYISKIISDLLDWKIGYF